MRHPLVISLLNHKWRAYGRTVYYTNLLIYVIFMAVLNSYMLTVPPPFAISKLLLFLCGQSIFSPFRIRRRAYFLPNYEKKLHYQNYWNITVFSFIFWMVSKRIYLLCSRISNIAVVLNFVEN